MNPIQSVRDFYARHFIKIGLITAVLVALAITRLVFALDPDSGSLPPGIFQLLSLPPLLLFLLLHTAIWTYDKFLNPWWQFLKSDEPKLFADLLPEWDALPGARYDQGHKQTRNALLYYALKFLFRCTRTAFSWLPLLVLLHYLYSLLTLSLNLAPH